MTRITFLIGNGFDLNVGLDTRYTDFYEYYIKNNPDDTLAKAIDANYIYWSDLELGLGRYTEQVRAEDEDSFWDSEENLEQELANFLEIQMNRVNIGDDVIKTETALEMQRSLNEFHKKLPELQQQLIDTVLDDIRESITYSFITFNYTNVLDQCIHITKRVIPLDFGKHNASDGLIYPHTIGDVLHIHGTTDAEMVLGVNDEEQIANKAFNKNTLYKQLLIKEETNKRFDRGKVEDARHIIDESIIICVFGMSIGRTDKIWWQYICKWLENDENRLLIIYIKVSKNMEKKRLGKRTLFRWQDEMLNRLKNNADLPDEVWERIRNQIYVECKTDMFNFKIVNK